MSKNQGGIFKVPLDHYFVLGDNKIIVVIVVTGAYAENLVGKTLVGLILMMLNGSLITTFLE